LLQAKYGSKYYAESKHTKPHAWNFDFQVAYEFEIQ